MKMSEENAVGTISAYRGIILKSYNRIRVLRYKLNAVDSVSGVVTGLYATGDEHSLFFTEEFIVVVSVMQVVPSILQYRISL
jgi:hypothetical protein